MIYELPLPYRAVDYLGPAWDEAKMQTVLTYLEGVATQAGYIMGPEGMAYSERGTIVVDLDREPDLNTWLNIDPDKPRKDAEVQLAQQAASAITALNAGMASPVVIQKAIAWLLSHHPEIQEALRD